jgi:hypothetical protein
MGSHKNKDSPMKKIAPKIVAFVFVLAALAILLRLFKFTA